MSTKPGQLHLTDDPATFALTYVVPAGHEVVSTGRHRTSSEDGGRTVSSWQAELPLRSAGFSYGTYKSWVDNEETKSFTVRAVTHRKAGEVVKKISRAIRGNGSDPAGDFGGLDAVAYERGMTRLGRRARWPPVTLTGRFRQDDPRRRPQRNAPR